MKFAGHWKGMDVNMAEMVNVAVDAMGGDNAPAEIVKGAIEAIKEDKRVKVFLVGREPDITAELKKYEYDSAQVQIVHAEEVIEMAEPPVMAIRKKKDSSIVRAMNMVKESIRLIGKFFNQDQINLLMHIADCIPPGDRLMHGDLQTKNAMLYYTYNIFSFRYIKKSMKKSRRVCF